MEKIALFDFDGTICPGDSVVPYLFFCIQKGWAPKHQILIAAIAYIRQKLHCSSVVTAKSASLSFLKGRKVTEADQLARLFFEEKLKRKFYQDAIREMNRLRSLNVKIVVISASAEAWMRVLPEYLPIDDVIATPCLNDGQGKYNGMIPINCRSEEKMSLFRQKYGNDWDIVAAYGDSSGDLPMLQASGQPHLIHPSSKLIRKMPNAKICHWR